MREKNLGFFLVGLMVLAPALAGADGGCTPEVPIGQDPSAGAGGDDREPVTCGETACPLGQVCCNPSCGVCTPPDGACTTELCDDRSCSDTMNAIRSLVAEHQSCTTDSDCEAVNVSCLPSANCTGNVYVNRELDQRALLELTRELNTCVNGQPDGGCPVCDRFDPPPVCLDGVCQSPTTSEPPPDPCSGKACGETCSTCIDGEPCRAILETCDANGQCGGSAPCGTPARPCEGKACGDACSNCVSGQPCLAILEFCDANGVCGGTTPACR